MKLITTTIPIPNSQFHHLIQTPEIHWYQFTHARFLHGHTIYHIHGCHCLLVVCNYDKLRIVGEFADHLCEFAYVGVIQWGIHLIQYAEWCGLYQVYGKQECR